MKPLEGIRVVELSTVVAASSIGRRLTQFGATSIKVESLAGDQFRTFGKTYQTPCTEDENPIFDQLNGCKRSIPLNLKTADGMEVMLKLLEQADVFVTNTRARALERLGLDYDTLKEKFPRLVYATITGYGDTGPEKDLPGFDTTAFWGVSGFNTDMSVMTGEYLPTMFPGGMGDSITAAELTGGICAALAGRERTGKGDRVTASLLATSLWSTSLMTVATQFGRRYPMTRYEGSPTPYRCKDGEFLIFTILSSFEKQFTGVCKAIGKPEMLTDQRFWPQASFVKPENTKAFIQICEAAFATKTCEAWLEILRGYDVACSRMNHFKDFVNNEQAKANGFIHYHTMPSGRQCWVTLPPCRTRRAGEPEFQRAPYLGEHTCQILEELGYSQERITKMLEEGVTLAHA
ncbi:MAG: CoA transferase [Lachnospiraceae bacterium]|jgi:crotonobetainyl-CoA:carnitine CoA-transferase CaiB-like acyl-CoA transferase|nr:CoA transferase [Lachnospiraceae bacterium]